MTETRHVRMSPVSQKPAPPALRLSPAVVAALTQLLLVQTAQMGQLEALLSWQRSVLAAGQEAWDQWVCRFGGGVPIGA